MKDSYLRFFFVLAFFMGISLSFFAQEEDDVQALNALEKDKAKKDKSKQDKIKKGWNFGGLPVLSFDSDLGFQFGALANLYNYGDGSRYPMYDHSFYVEASWFTKGSGIFRFYYDSDRLIKGIRTSMDVSYMPDQAFYFFGYNGYEAYYNSKWIDPDSPEYKTKMFYRLKRQFFRVKIDFQGNITGSGKIKWLAGFDFYNIYQTRVDFEHLNKGKSEDKILPDTATLYDEYVKWGLIPESEKNGGYFTALKGGIVFDTRDNEPNPNRGLWTEIILIGAPKFLSSMEKGFMKLSITHRQYFTLVKDRLTFAYRLAFQSTIAGYAPTYVQQLMYYSRMVGAYNEGLGGAKTLRGIKRNRMVGDGWVMGNFELRWKFVKFHWIKQNWYLALSGFFDTGRVIKFIDIKNKVENADIEYPEGESQSDYFNFGGERFHNSAGAGLHIAMNQNFIIAIDYGMALNKQDGNSGLYVGLNFLF